MQAPSLREIEGAQHYGVAMILLVSNVVCVYLIFVEVKLMFGCCFHLSLCNSCSISISQRIRPFTIHHSHSQCLYFVDTVLFSLKHFSSIVFLLWKRFLHLFAMLCKRSTKTTHSGKLKLNFGIQWCIITSGIPSLPLLSQRMCLHQNNVHTAMERCTGKFAIYTFSSHHHSV